jgi:hypothetical protein
LVLGVSIGKGIVSGGYEKLGGGKVDVCGVHDGYRGWAGFGDGKLSVDCGSFDLGDG